MAKLNRKAEILSAAIELFRMKGFAAVSTRDLADHAGLSRSHVYHYFDDWDQLRREAFLAFSKDQLAHVSAPLRDAPPTRALEGFLRACLPADADGDWTLWLDAWDEALHDPELARIYLDADAQWRAMLMGIIEHGVATGDFRCAAPDRAARQLFSLAMGQANDLLLAPSERAAERALDEVMEVAGLLLDLPSGSDRL
jgi:AcrR family transcriptional regulator